MKSDGGILEDTEGDLDTDDCLLDCAVVEGALLAPERNSWDRN